MTQLNFSLQDEVFPFEELAFPRADTETLRGNIIGYNAGVDMTWRVNRKNRAGAARALFGRQERIHTNRRAAG